MRAAIVTGVSRGLGEALARRLLADGFHVLGLGRTSGAHLAGDRYTFVEIDLADAARITAACAGPFAALADARPAFVALLNNAALAEPAGRIGHLDDGALARGLTINLTAPALLCNLFCRAFPGPEGERRIINVSSGLAQRTVAGAGLYSVAKAGLEMLTAALVTDHRDPLFRAISVRPGIIDTGMQRYLRSQSPEVLPAAPMFEDFHKGGQLVPADTTARVIVEKLVHGAVEHGRTYAYQELVA